MRRLLFLPLFLLLNFTSYGQSDAILDVMKESDEKKEAYWDARRDAWRNPDAGVHADSIVPPEVFRGYWIYPSTMRAINVSRAALWDDLSIGLEQTVILVSADMKKETMVEEFRSINEELKEQGFETWIDMSGTNFAALQVSEAEGEIRHFVGLGMYNDQFMIIDYEGKMTPEQLMELRNMSMEDTMDGLFNENVLSLFGL
ncbi:MAG: hypothetical protein MK081_10510 [Flavobacteriales bacterium]|nr:hypothetical protein [Flavobacteriales bacterium]